MRRMTERLIGSWLFVCCVPLAIFLNTDITKGLLSFSENLMLLVATAVIFGALTLFACIGKRQGRDFSKLDTGLMVSSAVVFSVLVGYHCADAIETSLAAVLIIAVSITYGSERGLFRTGICVSKKVTVAVLIVLSVGLTVYIGAISVVRYLGYRNPTYDFGIFAQMFHYMKESFLPMTTCERDQLLSHFAVHISPVFYLILPVYLLLPYALTIQFAQAVIVAAGIVPLYLLCRKKQLKRLTALLFCAVYCLYPALSGGTFFDIHENCFLTVFLLFVFYFYESKKTVPMWIFAVLTLGVKEDAAVYIAFFAIYIMLADKQWKKGILLFFAAVGYFAFAIFMLKHYGLGAMNYRYSEYITNDSLAQMVLNVIGNPGLVLKNAFTAEKFKYIIQMLLPLSFLPLLTKKLPRFLLLCPMLLINIMTDYPYQYNITFQYSFGTLAFLFYLSVLNYSDLRCEMRRRILPTSVCAAVMLFSCVNIPFAINEMNGYRYNMDNCARMDEALETIPPDAEVRCDGMLLPHLSDRKVLYDMEYSKEWPQYVVIDCRKMSAEDTSNDKGIVGKMETCFLNGYRIYRYEPDLVAVFIKDVD